MSKDGSVAPKERINIQYKSATGDLQESVELPNKMLIMGDFGVDDGKTVDDREPIGVDKDNFDTVMSSHKLSIDMNVENKLSDQDGDEPEQLSVHLDINNLKDLTPDELVKQVPELAQLIELRDALKAVKGPLGNVPDFRKKLASIVTDDDARKKFLDELDVDGEA